MNEIERLQRLLQLEVSVRAMRHWQREYFKRKEKNALVESLRLEKKVDGQLADLDVEKIRG